jgi:multimeric flavodoxin WrbA
LKIVMIHGQNHKGSTYHIGRSLAEKLAKEDEITEFFLPKDLNHFCTGCYQCIEDETKCPYYKEVRIITDAMEGAEQFIFTTPNYCMGPSASMKALIDMMFDYWMPHRPRKWMFTKKAVIISTAAGAGTGQAIKGVKTALTYWGVPYIKSYGISVQAKNWAEVKKDKKAKIEKDMTKLAQRIMRVGTPKAGIKTRFLFNIMARMHSAGWDSSPVEKQYWAEHGWLNKERPWKK